MHVAKATLDQLNILLFVEQCGRPCVPVPLIAKRFDLSVALSNKLVARLTRTNLLKAKRGPGGGVVLARSAEAIPLGSTIRLLEELNSEKDDLYRGGTSTAHQILGEAFSDFLDLLDDFSLADLAKNGDRSRLKHVRKGSLRAFPRRPSPACRPA